MASVFTKIIAGEIPSLKIFEDEHVLAILDIQPIHLGHVIIFPKKEIDHFTDVPEPYFSSVHLASQKIGKAIRKVTGAPRVGTAVQGFEVPHFHLHLIPLWSPRDLDFTLGKKRSEAEMKKMHAELSAAMEA
ncbi:MAG: HIT family protein [Proteobacteria bacterium]|nr:MAG: HIT family protein [Pseudomonadota bacterium]